MNNLVLLITTCLYVTSAKGYVVPSSTDTLELLHVIFRHGDRTPDSLYPNDPYKEFSFYPVGVGQLTNPGKVRSYNIGVALREKYGKFLGNIYTPSLIEANSSNYPRCRATILLVLAALFPPSAIEQWNQYLKWQPIPYQYLPQSQDPIFWAMAVCSTFTKLSQQVNDIIEASGALNQYAEIFDYLTEKSGMVNQSGLAVAGNVFSTLKSEEEWGLALPPWTESVWPEPLTTLAALSWESFVGSKNLSTIMGGFMMSKIVDDTYSKINGDPAVQNRKLYLYSGHDSNIAAVLSWLGVFIPHSPPYSSYITIEVHNISGERIVVIYYQSYLTPVPQPITIPGCGLFCPFDTFVQLYEPYLNPEPLCN